MAGSFNAAGISDKSTKLIVNPNSDGGTHIAYDMSLRVGGLGKSILSGALTANTYKEILSVSGIGILKAAFVMAMDNTGRTMGIKVVLDGVTAFDAVSSACTTQYGTFAAVGGFNYIAVGSHDFYFDRINFNSSLSISVKSSISETDKVKLFYNYETR